MTNYDTLPADLLRPEDDGAAAHLPGRTVLYIYPLTGRPGVDPPAGWDHIPGARGCASEACSFRDRFHDLIAAGAAHVYGLSTQDCDYQTELVERLHLPFPMLSDPDRQLAAVLALPTFEAGDARLYKRITLVIRAGFIEHVFYPSFPPDQHAEQVVAWLRRTA